MNIRGYKASLSVNDNKGTIEIRVDTHDRGNVDEEHGEDNDDETDEDYDERGRPRGRRASGGRRKAQTQMQKSRRALQDLRGSVI